MHVRIRLGRGRKVKQNKPEVRRLAMGVSVLLQPAVLAASVLAAWRFGTDVGWTRDFVIPTGPFSHWQTWLAIAVALQIAVIALNRYGSFTDLPKADLPKSEALERESILKSEFDQVR
jgi:hypothetical protein